MGPINCAPNPSETVGKNLVLISETLGEKNMAANVKSQLAQLANLSHSKDVIDK